MKAQHSSFKDGFVATFLINLTDSFFFALVMDPEKLYLHSSIDCSCQTSSFFETTSVAFIVRV